MGGQYPAAASVERAMGNRRSINANQRRTPRQDAAAFAGGEFRGRGGNLQQPGAALQRRLAGGVTGAAGATPPAVDLPPGPAMPPVMEGKPVAMPAPAPVPAGIDNVGAAMGGAMPPPGMGKPMGMGGPPAYANFGLPPQVMQQLQNLRGVPQLSANPMPPPGAVSTPGQPPPMPVPEQASSLANMYDSFIRGRRQM